MNADFTLPDGWRVEKTYALPQTYRGYVLRGAKVVSAACEAGSIIIQSFEQPLFTIRYKHIAIIKNAKLVFKQKKATLISFLSLKNDVRFTISGLESVKLKEGQLSLLHMDNNVFSVWYEKNKTYQTLEIDWGEELIREGYPFFTLLEPAMIVSPGKNFFVGHPVNKATTEILSIANEILKSPYDEKVSGLLFQNKARDYFFFIMMVVGRVPASHVNLTEEEWQRIDEISVLLTTHPDKKFPIIQLAARAQMNTMKFKQAFKEKYNAAPFEYQMAQRMGEALDLLREGRMNAKEVAAYIGYKGLSSFITKFREYHGYPPGKVKRNRF